MTKRILLVAVLTALCYSFSWSKARLSPHSNLGGGTYNFWLYLPDDYETSKRDKPLIVFLHGASLCGKNLNQVKRYGLIDAVEDGRKIDAIIVAPQCPGGGWKPDRVHATIEWVKKRYHYDDSRVYVVGMSLGGYGTIDFCSTYPDEVAAGIAMCGGATVNAEKQKNLAKLPFWIIHGTADRAVTISKSKEVVANIKKAPGGGLRLKTTWLQGGNHGAPARVFYHRDTYHWLFSHALTDAGRPVNRNYDFTLASLRRAYDSMPKGVVAVQSASAGAAVKKFVDSDFDLELFENITYDDVDYSNEFVPAGFED